MNEAKPFCITKKEVWEAYQRVKENKGAAGVDDQSIEDFEKTEEEPLQDLESDVIGQLLSTTGADGEDTKEKRWGKKAGHSHSGRSNRTTGCEGETRAGIGTAVSCRLLRLSTGEVGIGCSGPSAREMLAL